MARKDYPVILLNLPATVRQRRLILTVAVALFAAFWLAAPFATTPMRRLDAFIPTLEAMIFVNDLITSILLFRAVRYLSLAPWVFFFGLQFCFTLFCQSFSVECGRPRLPQPPRNSRPTSGSLSKSIARPANASLPDTST